MHNFIILCRHRACRDAAHPYTNDHPLRVFATSRSMHYVDKMHQIRSAVGAWGSSQTQLGAGAALPGVPLIVFKVRRVLGRKERIVTFPKF